MIMQLLLLLNSIQGWAYEGKGNGLNLDSILHVLDAEIGQRGTYRQEKERKLASLKELLGKSTDTNHSFALCNELFGEYKHYQYDSAYVYATRSLRLAEKMQSLESIAQAKCYLIFCYTSVGFFKEADEVNRGMSGIEELPLHIQEEYYSLCVYLYQSMRNFVSGTDSLSGLYDALRQEAHDRTLKCASAKEDEYMRTLATDMLTVENQPPGRIAESRKRLLDKYSLSLHEQAVQYFMIGEMTDGLGNRREAAYYMAMSAICDIRSSTHETSAAKVLASYMYEAGEIDRAFRYIHLAQDDAHFYNTRVRKMEINSILPLIESRRYEWINRQRNLLFAIAALVTLSLVPLAVMFRSLKRRNRSLQEARNEIERKALALDAANSALSMVNNQLKEANEIKDSYIIQSLYGDSGFVNSVEEKCKLMERKLKAKQYADLPQIIREMNVKQERERMSSAFDAAFLKLFPNFMEEYNKLFAEEDRACVFDDGMLPTEIRIFALMRLGISDTTLVAKYLNISQNTIYVYKAKVKARTIVPKDDFDARIMAIPKP